MPKQKPGVSKQDYQTPQELLDSIKALLNMDRWDIDLASSNENHIKDADLWYTEQDNALSWFTPWHNKGGWNWLNPPYGRINPWVERAWEESQIASTRTMVLIPSSTGANWWKNWVHTKATVLFLTPRVTFVPMTTPYPKDLALLLYGMPSWYKDYMIFDWKAKELY